MINSNNFQEIHSFAISNGESSIQGDKLRALHRLIQMKGEPMECPHEPNLDKVKAYNYGKGNYIAIIHKPIKDTFFPCKLHTIHLEAD